MSPGTSPAARRFRVRFPDGAAGDAIATEILARAGPIGVEGALRVKRELERDGPRPDDVRGVLDRRIELAAVDLRCGAWRLLVGCARGQDDVVVLGVETEPVPRRRFEAAARAAYGLAHAPLEWTGESR